MPVKQIIPYLDTILKKTENDIANIKKLHGFVKKKTNITLKNPNDLEKLHPGCQEVVIEVKIFKLVTTSLYLYGIITEKKQTAGGGGRRGIWNFQGYLRIASTFSRN